MAALTSLLQKISLEIDSTSASILSGSCKTPEEYRERIGRLRAFQEVVSMATEREKNSESTED